MTQRGSGRNQKHLLQGRSLPSSPWQKPVLFAVSIVGAVCDRAFFLELTKYGRSQTAPTIGNPSFRLLPRAARLGTGSSELPSLAKEGSFARLKIFVTIQHVD